MENNKLDEQTRQMKYCAEDGFLEDRLADKPCQEMRKMLGRHLFKIRQDYNRTLERVSKETEIPAWIIDSQEVGYKGFDWRIIGLLLDYYKKKINVELVNRYSDEELERMRREEREEAMMEEAKQIAAMARSVETAGDELMQKAKKTKIPSPQTSTTAGMTAG